MHERGSHSAPSREYPAAPLAGVGVIAVGDGRVLLVERRRPPSAGFWSVPGGLIELGETARAAAVREALEETAIAVELIEVAAVFDRIERDAGGRVRYHYVLIDFLARAAAGGCPPPRAGGDAGDARWVRWEELADFRLTPGLDDILAGIRRRHGG